MNVFEAAGRAVTKTADAVTATAGAVGGAAVNGVVSGARGVATGVRNGASNGSHSTAVAALTLGAIGAAGLVEWPILVAVGGTALVVHQLANQRNDKPSTSERAAPAVSSGSSSSAPNPPAKRAPVKKAAIKKRPAKRSPARKSNSRRASTARKS
jgi:hypothetical protein